MKKFGIVLKSILAVAAAISTGDLLAAAVPLPPSGLCIASSGTTACVTTPAVAATGGNVKWHPGHYLRPSEMIFAEKDWIRNAVWDIVKANPNLKGGMDVVPWGVIERDQGQYDFSQIDKDLAILKAGGKKLIIEPWWMNYWHSVPTNPQYGSWLPPYIIRSGCVEASPNGAAGYTVPVHRAECMDRVIALFVALGKKYDGDPAIEQIVITEPSAPYSSYVGNEAAFSTQFKRLIKATSEAWPNTSVVFYMNWMREPGDLMAYMASLKVGVGGPDIITPTSGEDDGSKALRGAGGAYGSIDYRGKVPINYSYEAAVNHGPPSALIDYTLNTLKATHVAWAVADWMDPGMNYLTGVLPTLQSAGWKVGSTACPTVYAGKCSAN